MQTEQVKVAVLQLCDVERSQRDQHAAHQRLPESAHVVIGEQKDAKPGQRKTQQHRRVKRCDRTRQQIDRQRKHRIWRAERLHIQLHAVRVEEQVGPERVDAIQDRLAHPPEMPQMQSGFFATGKGESPWSAVDSAEQKPVEMQRQGPGDDQRQKRVASERQRVDGGDAASGRSRLLSRRALHNVTCFP